MNPLFLSAGILILLLGLVHSTFGEYLIFRKFRRDGMVVPSISNKVFKGSHLRIIWATWHLVTIFGWSIGVILILIAGNPMANVSIDIIIKTFSFALLLASVLVLYGTKGRHPGWIVLLLIWLLLIISIFI